MVFTPQQIATKGAFGLNNFSALLGTSGMGEREILELYAISHTIYTCANVRAENVAAVPMRATDGKGNPIEHPVNAIFARTSNYQDVARRTELALFFVGTSLSLPQPNFAGNFTPYNDNLRWINPLLWTRDVDARYGLKGFRLSGRESLETGEAYIPLYDALYFQLIDLQDDFDGVAPGEVAFRAASSQAESWETVRAYMENRAIPATILQPTADNITTATNPDAPRRLGDLLQRLFQGSRNAGRTMVSPDRLESVQLQQDFDKLMSQSLTESQRQAITEAAQVPDVLVAFSGATYANGDAAVNFWRRHWLKPRADWYAGIYSKFFSRWYQQPIHIEPDLTDLIREDDDTDRINMQVSGGYLDLYTAQVLAGVEEPDERLKGVYIWNGTPTKIDEWFAQQTPAAPQPALAIVPPVRAVPDAIYREIEVASRKGAAFIPDALPDHTHTYISTLHELGVARSEIVKAAKAFYLSASAQKALQATRLDFEYDFENLLAAGRNDDLRRKNFGRELIGLIETYAERAYRDGLIDGGVADATLDDDDRDALNAVILDQRQYVRAITDRIYSEGGVSDAQAESKPAMWFSKSIYPSYLKGLESAARNGYFEWVYGDTEHCKDCRALNGQIHRLKDYSKSGWMPRASALSCGGFNCKCNLVPRPNAKARGRFPSTKHEHHEDDAHAIAI